MFPNLCQDPFSGPLIWKYGSPKNYAESGCEKLEMDSKKWKNKIHKNKKTCLVSRSNQGWLVAKVNLTSFYTYRRVNKTIPPNKS